MQRKILALSIATLTACGSGVPEADAGPPDTAASAIAPARAADRVVLFVGTSLTAGLGVGEDVAWPAVLQSMIDSVGLPFRVVNAGVSGETSAGGLRRIDWSLQQPADVLVLELGGNDALRGLEVRHMRANLDSIMRRARDLYPGISIVLAGMEAPPNLGDRYTTAFRATFIELAQQHDAALVPFLLEGVAAEPSLNLDDGIHPNADGHRIIARTVWRTLEPVLRERMTRPAQSPVS